jgi:hypothetical protein
MVHLDFTWISPGFHVELDNNLAGLPAKKFYLESMWNPCFHVDSMWNHLESMGEVFKVPDIRVHMEWSLIGTRGTVSPLHVESDGLGTVVVILDGSKYWIVATRFGESHIICSIDSLGPNWNPFFC